MVLKKPGQSDTAPAAKPVTGDTSFMEHLVKKSLDVNPGLRAGRSTQEVLKSLRQEAMANAQAGQPGAALSIPEATATPAASPDERRLKSIQFFLDQKGAEFASDSQGIASQIASLQAQLDGLRAAAISDLADFLSLVGGGSESPETRRALRDHRELLNALGVSEEALLKLTDQRR